jgi:hypothetical protein
VKPNNRIKRVALVDITTFKAYQKLKRGTFEEKRFENISIEQSKT